MVPMVPIRLAAQFSEFSMRIKVIAFLFMCINVIVVLQYLFFSKLGDQFIKTPSIKHHKELPVNCTEEQLETWEPIVFGFLVHDNIQLIRRLMTLLYHPLNYYIFHIDIKAPRYLVQVLTF